MQKNLFRFRGKNMLSIVKYGKISSFWPTFCQRLCGMKQ